MAKNDLVFGPLNKRQNYSSNDDFGSGLEQEDPDTDALVVENMILSLCTKKEIEESFENGDIDTLLEDGLLTENSVDSLLSGIKQMYTDDSLIHRTSLLIAKERNDIRMERVSHLFEEAEEILNSVYEDYEKESKLRINEDKYMMNKSSCKLARKVMDRCRN